MNSLAYTHYWRGESQPAIELLHAALSLDLKHPNGPALWNIAEDRAHAGPLRQGHRVAPPRASGGAELAFRDPTLAVAYVLKGNREKAREIATEMNELDPGLTISERIEDRADGLDGVTDLFDG